jgi:hypothetical protein
MMKKIVLLSVACLTMALQAQTVKEANVYPTNLEENMYFGKYDAATSTISGIYFMVLSDGENSEFVTPAFEVSLYLIPQGKNSASDATIVKTYPLDGIYHMGSHEFKDESVDISSFGLTEGTYRLGLWVNSNSAFEEDGSDNAMLFNTPITIGQTTEAEDNGDWGW